MAAQVFVSDVTAPEVTEQDRHHLVRVLRLTAGELVIAADGLGGWTRCRFTGADPLLEPESAPTRSERVGPAITIAFAPAKGDRPEWVVQKLTELGIDRIVPVATDRSVVRWSGERAERAAERLRRVAREAAAQCRRPWLPELAVPVSLSTLVETTGVAGPRLALADLDGDPPSLEHPLVAIGPEGGWSDTERALELPRTVLGDAVLRSETAAVVAGALLAGLRGGIVGRAGAGDP